jgi:hypothetical protein
MEEIAPLFSNWVFSKYGLAHFLGWAVITGSAIWCNRHRSIRRFVAIAFLVWLASALIALPGYWRISANEYTPIWSLVAVVLYTLPLGVMISQRVPAAALALVSLLLFAVQLPLSLVYSLAAYCYVGGDCV